jgi:hypothetical protein
LPAQYPKVNKSIIMSKNISPTINGGTNGHHNHHADNLRMAVLEMSQSERTSLPIGILRDTGLRFIDSADPARAQWVGTDQEYGDRIEQMKGGRVPLGMPSRRW